jgi:hypothetical protein
VKPGSFKPALAMLLAPAIVFLSGTAFAMGNGVPPDWRRTTIDSLTREQISFCAFGHPTRILVQHPGRMAGTLEGLAEADTGGLLITQRGGRLRHVPWDDIRGVEMLEVGQRRPEDAMAWGACIGYLAGVVTAIIIIPDPGGFGTLVYPMTIAIAAVPGAVVGGIVGLASAGGSWHRCWP